MCHSHRILESWDTEFLEWDTYLSAPLIGLDKVLVVELSPCEYITPVAEVIRAVWETVSEKEYIIMVHVQDH